ncbi:MAG: family transcriptional regulator [Bradyrhizobium sp.]|nr:family transcriptional regulator [Bradyrhizobium sp.]
MDMRRLVGRNLRRLRDAKGIRQEKLSELSGFGQQYISDIERGRRNPTVVTLFHIATALGVTPAELVAFDEGEPDGAVPPRARGARKATTKDRP